MSAYDHRTIEPTWQQRWTDDGLYRSAVDWDRPKHYAVTMLPYPSGNLHIGHWYAMTPSDARARFMRMKGFNVLFPMGFDAFGLPAENAAIQRNVQAAKWTRSNIEEMRRQLRLMGTMFDWDREIVSCDPSYYRWTEWFFAKFFEANIAYRGEGMVNWSPSMQTVLANEQVIDGLDERTGQPVEQKLMEQWFFAITSYADELLNFDGIDWPDPIKTMQTNWIGRSEGARVRFSSPAGDIEVFTTRPDTLWGATFMVLSPEHDLVDALTTDAQRDAVTAYQAAAAARSEIERTDETADKTGVFTGGYATNPVDGEQVPVWIADYVLVSYGTGAIMAVPAHDERDFAFARAFDLPVVAVIDPADDDLVAGDAMTEAYVGPGTIANSGPLDGTAVTEAKGRANPSIAAALDWLAQNKAGEETVNYRLRDWLISRQRYWGSPIPVVYPTEGESTGPQLTPDDQFPVVLPEDVEFDPTGRSPLNDHPYFTSASTADGAAARRETDTMDTFMCSSWYWYGYLSPGFETAPFDPEEAAYWLPVDTYTGGAEHAVMHLLYARFFTKAMRDIGIFDDAAAVMEAHGRDPAGIFDEPMLMLRNQGQILGEERRGDQLAVTGERDGNRIVAESVVVLEDGAEPPAGATVGELMRRTENTLRLDTSEGTITVEVPPEASVETAAVEGVNDVSQLNHHLDIQRMSKSKGNVVNPDDLVEQYGADTVRTYLMFAFEWQKGGPWDHGGIVGARRFLDDVWKMATADYAASSADDAAEADLRRAVHGARQKVGEDLEAFKWNTAVATLMGLRNDMLAALRGTSVSADAWNEACDTLVLLLAPIAPHITEELWHHRGHEGSVHVQSWPETDESLLVRQTTEMVVQVNGKVRDRVEVSTDIDPTEAEGLAMAAPNVAKHLEGVEVRKVINRAPDLINIVAN
jgi:leucyl-tRNA synthetase